MVVKGVGAGVGGAGVGGVGPGAGAGAPTRSQVHRVRNWGGSSQWIPRVHCCMY